MLRIIFLTILMTFALAGPAIAQTDATGAGYGGAAGEVDSVDTGIPGGGGEGAGEPNGVDDAGVAAETDSDDGTTAAAPRTQAAASAGDLPFTGVDALLIAAGGMVLLASGVTVRRLARDSRI